MIPLFFPPVTYLKGLTAGSFLSLEQLCERAGVVCRASGAWTEREVQIVFAENFRLFAEPGDWGRVRIEVPCRGQLKQARLALAALAYSMQDLVAKQSVRGEAWLSLKPPRGRPKRGQALTGKERQRKFRQRTRRERVLKNG